MTYRDELARRLAAVQGRIARACERSDRDPASVTLVAVSKRQPLAAVQAAWDLGLRDFGESYAQELQTRYAAALSGVRWHFIGHLQRNKVRAVLPGVHLLHSLDSLRLAEAVAGRAQDLGVPQPVLLELGTGEETKTGSGWDEAPALARALAQAEGLDLQGLMGMAPWGSEGEEARAAFRRVRGLAEALRQELSLPLPELSMGMSGDLEEAVEEGATLVRVGEALFGPRGARA